MDITNSTLRTKLESVEHAAKSVKLARSPLLPASPVILQETEFSELIALADLPVSVFLDTFPLLTDLVFNPTVMLILSAHNASKDSSSAFNALLPKTELLSSLKAFVSVWMAIMPMPVTSVFSAETDVESVHQPLTVLLVLLWQHPAVTEFVHALKKPTSLFLLMV